ncbi:hypothetical protein PFDG_04286 [Plasmodium falciparum Dd2]|uniref:Uncharacterized protein n=1 Tax=Plasmodium falciparum (isolate Dd2) TaxID=57267 RepID=A0A0L7M4N8_PLAF4|nr:hypothetical protein PFDG_04286 [Plasmodium falciparum Dd2]
MLIVEPVPVEKHIFKQIQMGSIKRKIIFYLWGCFKNNIDSVIMKEVFNLIETAE